MRFLALTGITNKGKIILNGYSCDLEVKFPNLAQTPLFHQKLYTRR